MGAAFLITLREGIEAALIISILLAYLRQLGRFDRATLVWWGSGAAIAISVGVAAVLFAIEGEFQGTGEQVFEGVVSLTAVAVLTWMIFWMRRQGAKVRSELHGKVDSALLGSGLALATLAFVVVLREGIETALFVFAAAKGMAVANGGVGDQVIGAFLGLMAAFVMGVLLYRGAIKLNLRTFFKITGALLLVVAAGLVAFAVAELQEAGVLPFLSGVAYDVSRTLSDQHGVGAILHSLVGYQDAPSVLAMIAWVAYLAVAGMFFFRPHAPAVAQPNAVVAERRSS